jgi:hypothetical protein
VLVPLPLLLRSHGGAGARCSRAGAVPAEAGSAVAARAAVVPRAPPHAHRGRAHCRAVPCGSPAERGTAGRDIGAVFLPEQVLAEDCDENQQRQQPKEDGVGKPPDESVGHAIPFAGRGFDLPTEAGKASPLTNAAAPFKGPKGLSYPGSATLLGRAGCSFEQGRGTHIG